MKRSAWHTCKKAVWEWRGVWIAAPIATGLVIFARQVGFLQYWEWAAYDQYMSLRPAELQDRRIGIVGINEIDIQRLSQSILPDRVYATLINKLKQMEPVGIGLDVYRDVPVEPGNRELEQVFNSTDNLVGIEKIIGSSNSEQVPGAKSLKLKNQIASNDLVLDRDDRIRRALLSLRDLEGNQIFGLGAYLALLYLEGKGITPSLAKDGQTWKLGGHELLPFTANDGGYAAADDGGYQILLNYRGSRDHFETVSLSDILEDRAPPDWGKNRLILIGYTGFSFQDIVATPFTTNPSQRMAGVEVHANIASQLISTALDNRSPLKVWPDSLEKIWILLWAVLGSLVSWSQRNKLLSRRRIVLTVVLLALLAGIGYGQFRNNLWIPIVPPALSFLISVSLLTAYTARSAVRIRQTFGRYMSIEVVTALLESNELLKLGGERRVITILMADLRGFTAFCEKLSPEEVIRVVNCYLSSMTDIINQYKGTIDEFLGDGILVLFGAPLVREDDADRAIACGIAMQQAIEQVNHVIGAWGYSDLEMGIGINTGAVIVGNIGSEKRMTYGVVGSHVNLASRIESFTIGGQVLISESTLKSSQSLVRVKGKKVVNAKGFSEPVVAYDVTGIDDYGLYLKIENDSLTDLACPLQICFSIVSDKAVSNIKYFGDIVSLNLHRAKIKLSCEGAVQSLVMLDNLKLDLVFEGEEYQSDSFYGKVDLIDPINKIFEVVLTFLPKSMELRFERLVAQEGLMLNQTQRDVEAPPLG
jgi:adenylate cyclase